MADGKIRFQISAETKEARKELQQMQKEFLKTSETVSKLIQKLNTLRKNNGGGTEKEAELQRQIAYAVSQRERAYQDLVEAQQAVAKSEKLDKVNTALSVTNRLLKNSALLGLRFAKAMTVDKITRGFTKLTKGVRNFGRRLKYVILQGLLFRNLRRYLSEFASAIGNAFKQNEQFNASLANLKGTFWASIAPVIDALAPIIARFLDMIAKLITYLSGLIGILFNIGKASKAAGAGLAKAGKSGKEASKNLASWDTIQNLDSGSGGSADSGISPTFGQDFEEAYTALDKFRELFEKGDWFEIGKYVGEKLNEVIKVVDQWINGTLSPKIKKWAYNASQFINGFFTGVDWYSAGTMISDALNGIIDSIGTFFETLDGAKIGESIGIWLTGIIHNFDVKRAGESLFALLGTLIDLLINLLANIDWEGLGRAIIDFIVSIDWGQLILKAIKFIGSLISAVVLFLIGILRRIDEFMSENVIKPIVEALTSVWEWIKQAAVTAYNAISAFLQRIVTWIDEKIILPIVNFFVNAFNKIKDGVSNAIQAIKDWFLGLKNKIVEIWNNIKIAIAQILTGIINTAKTIITAIITKWNELKIAVANVFDNIGQKASSLWTNLKNGVRSVINWIIRFINGLITRVESAINWIISGLNKISFNIPDWVPLIGGKRFGFNLNTVSLGRLQELPALAQGGVVNPGHAFTAILGDNRHEQEIVSPLSTMKQALLEALQESGMSDGGQIILNIDGRQVATAIVPHMNNASRAYGRSVIR